MTGSDRERELVETLEATGWASMRCPSSGAGTKRELPDVLAGRGVSGTVRGMELGKSLAIELKSGKSTTLYVQPEEVEALESFAERFGATPLLAARFTSRGSPVRIYGVPPSEARKTDSGAYGLPVDSVEDRASVIWTPPVGDREADVVWCVK